MEYNEHERAVHDDAIVVVMIPERSVHNTIVLVVVMIPQQWINNTIVKVV